MPIMSVAKARELILRGAAPKGLTVRGLLRLDWGQNIALPEDLRVECLEIHWNGLKALPKGLSCTSLSVFGSEITALPEDLRVTQRLSLTGCRELRSLPGGLTVHTLDLTGCARLRELPAGLRVVDLNVSGCTALRGWPRSGIVGLERLTMRDCTHLETLPAGLSVRSLGSLDLRGCTRLRELPDNLHLDALDLSGCIGLQALPERLHVKSLNVSGCTALTQWPHGGVIGLRQLNMRNCAQLRTLPACARRLMQLDVSGCANLRQLPRDLRVTEWLDIGGTPLRSLPAAHRRHFQFRWRGVELPRRFVLHPEVIAAHDVTGQRNVEVRRALLECMGYERFMLEAKAQVLDEDTDAGGPRSLLSVPMQWEEALVCLSVRCPSTGRLYIIRVPPRMQRCHQAAAWLAGFDNPDDYQPLAET